MKGSKNFATENAQSHLPSQMHHTTAEAIGVDVPMSNDHIVVLSLQQRRSVPYSLKLRMTAKEALALAETLQQAAHGCGVFTAPTN